MPRITKSRNAWQQQSKPRTGSETPGVPAVGSRGIRVGVGSSIPWVRKRAGRIGTERRLSRGEAEIRNLGSGAELWPGIPNRVEFRRVRSGINQILLNIEYSLAGESRSEGKSGEMLGDMTIRKERSRARAEISSWQSCNSQPEIRYHAPAVPNPSLLPLSSAHGRCRIL